METIYQGKVQVGCDEHQGGAHRAADPDREPQPAPDLFRCTRLGDTTGVEEVAEGGYTNIWP